jgi:hypothetical protein
MQHDLHHRELVEVGVEQALDDHGAVRRLGRDRGRLVVVLSREKTAVSALRAACARLSRPSSACAYDRLEESPTTFRMSVLLHCHHAIAATARVFGNVASNCKAFCSA